MGQPEAETTVDLVDSRTTAAIVVHQTTVDLVDARTTAEIAPLSTVGQPDTGP